MKPKGGVLRSTFLIDRTGALRHQWKGVKVDGHVDEVLEVLRSLWEADREVDPVMLLRRSTRAISSETLSEEELGRLAEAATLAPSCFNNQPWRIVIATGDVLEEVKGALSRGNAWALSSPAIVALAAAKEDDCEIPDGRSYSLFDTGLAAENLMLQATRMGLVAHPIAGFEQAKVRAALKVPKKSTVIVLIVLGRPGDISNLSEKHQETEAGPRQRRHMDELVGWNRYVEREG